MPTIKRFRRYRIEMYFGDHGIPHFHVITNDDERASVIIETLEIQAGEADARDVREALDWAADNKPLLNRKWNEFTKGGVKMKPVRVMKVKAVKPGVLRIQWKHELKTTVDIGRVIRSVRALAPLVNATAFAAVKPGEGGHSVAWSNGLDMGADRLWEMAMEQAGRKDALEFHAWRARNRLSLQAAADELALARRTVAYYDSGTKSVPRTVLLACKGWEIEKHPGRVR